MRLESITSIFAIVCRHAVLPAAFVLTFMMPQVADAEEGFAKAKALIDRYGCGTCHEIPGISGASGRVGPPLIGIGGRVFIVGKLANTPGNMARWIEDPQNVVPGNAMPTMGISSSDASEIATYLETLKEQPSD